MNKKILFIVFLIAIFSVFFAYLMLQRQEKNGANDLIGDFLFEKTNQQGNDVSKIILKTSEMQLSLYYDKNFWRVKEADNYYADLVTVNTLLQNISKAKIEAVAATNTEFESNIEIQTFNKNGTMLDSVTIGKKQNNFLQAKIQDNNVTYLVSGDFSFPDKIYYWLQQPLISLAPKSVENIIMQTSTGQQLAYRMSQDSSFYNLRQKPTNIQPLLDKFVLFNFIDVKQIQNTPLNNTSPQKIIVLFTYSGLIYGVEIFDIEGEYWIKIDLSITKLPTKLASDYIKDSRFLYQDWAFKINKKLGKYLTEYKIN